MAHPEERLYEAYERYQRILLLAALAAEFPFVPGEGPLNSPLMFVGEAPGAEESRQLRPFVGPAGRKLDQLLGDFSRAIARTTNVVHYQMPGNRSPYHYEISASRPCLFEEMDIVRPLIVVPLGASALNALGSPVIFPRLSDCHGKKFSWSHPAGWNTIVYPVLHPSYALRNREAEELLEKDLQELVRMCNGA